MTGLHSNKQSILNHSGQYFTDVFSRITSPPPIRSRAVSSDLSKPVSHVSAPVRAVSPLPRNPYVCVSGLMTYTPVSFFGAVPLTCFFCSDGRGKRHRPFGWGTDGVNRDRNVDMALIATLFQPHKQEHAPSCPYLICTILHPPF